MNRESLEFEINCVMADLMKHEEVRIFRALQSLKDDLRELKQ